jgi:multiple sugar transport system substrate-binding protein
MEEGKPAEAKVSWTGKQIAIVVALLVVTNAITGVAVFFSTPVEEEALVVIHPWSGSERDLFLPVLEAFTAKTGIKVKDIIFRQEDLQPILPAQFEAKQTPGDVIFMASSFIKQWGKDGHVVDVTAMVDESKYLPGALDPVKDGSTIYGGAYTGKVKPGFWYKKSLFEAKGWNQAPANFDEFKALLQTIKDSGITPIVSGDEVGWPLSDVVEHFIATYGGAQMHKDLISGAKSWTDPDVKNIFTTYIVPLLEAGYFGPPQEWTSGVQDLWDEKFALYFMGSWLPTMSQIGDTDDMAAMSLPGGVENQGVVFAVDYLFIPKYTDKMDQAKQLFEFLISKEGQEAQIAQGGHFATHVEADPSVAPPAFQSAGELIAGKEILPDLDDTVGGEFQTTFWSQLKLLWVDPGALDDVLAAIDEKAP